jgi:hypothetical protein
MSVFEFLSVSVAIVLALTLGRLMTAVNDVFAIKRRDILHVGFYSLSFVGILTMWWAQWMMVGVEAWTFADFVLVMASPIAQYFTVHALLSPNPAEVESWRSYLTQNHRWIFSAFLAQTIAVAARRFIVADDTSFLLLFFMGLHVSTLLWAILSNTRTAQTVVLIVWGTTLGYAVSVQFAIAH